MKLEGLTQCAGEAIYANDYPHTSEDVWCAWIVATEVNATIAKIDASDALVSENGDPHLTRRYFTRYKWSALPIMSHKSYPYNQS